MENNWALREAAAHEKLARQQRVRGNVSGSVASWTSAAEIYFEERVLDRVVACLVEAGTIDEATPRIAHEFDFDTDRIVASFRSVRCGSALALLGLHLLSLGRLDSEAAVAWCLEPLTDHALGVAEQLRFLKAALVGASGNDAQFANVVSIALRRLPRDWLSPPEDADFITPPDDAAPVLIAGFLLTGERRCLRVLGAIGSRACSSGPGHSTLRLLLPLHLQQGVGISTLVDLIQEIPALSFEHRLYQNLLSGFAAGLPEQALQSLASALVTRWNETPRQIHSWADTHRLLSRLPAVQPETLAHHVLWDQVSAFRAAWHQLAATGAGTNADDWEASFLLFERVQGQPLIEMLPPPMRVDLFRLGAAAAYRAREWERFDSYATTLETRYGSRSVLASCSREGPVRLLAEAALHFEAGRPERAGEAWALTGEHRRAGDAYRTAGHQHRLNNRYEAAKRAYLSAALAYGTIDSMQPLQLEMGRCAEACEKQLQAEMQSKETRGAGEVQAHAAIEAAKLGAGAIREGCALIGQAVSQASASVARAHREALLEGAARIAGSLDQGFGELVLAARRGNLVHLLTAYARAAGSARLGTEAAMTAHQLVEGLERLPVSEREGTAVSYARLFQIFADAVSAGAQGAPSSPPTPAMKVIVERERNMSDVPAQVTATNCPVASGPPNVVLNISKAGGRVCQRCTVAEKALNRVWHGIDALSASALRQGGCPLPNSLGPIQRHLWAETCVLADGREHDL